MGDRIPVGEPKRYLNDSFNSHIYSGISSTTYTTPARQMVEALNDYFRSQAEVPGKCLVDYVQFDTRYELAYSDKEVAASRAVINPRGGTALLDAIGKAVLELKAKLKALPEVHRPAKVQVVIVTDGEENSSWQYNYEQIKSLVKKQTKKGWDFVFLGANIDAVSVGSNFGIVPEKALTFNIASAAAVGNTSNSLSAYTTNYRGLGASAATFSDDDRNKALSES